jgi:hypothetical protein
MDIVDSRKNNTHVLDLVEKWLDLPKGSLIKYYIELVRNVDLLKTISDKIEMNKSFKKDVPGLFLRTPIKNVDWYGFQRILLYCLVREKKPNIVVETGVYYGGNSVFILAAMHKNKSGKLYGIDYPQKNMDQYALSNRHSWLGNTENYSKPILPGFIIPEALKEKFELFIDDSLEVLPKIKNKIDLFVHDSEHTMGHVLAELNLIWKKMSNKGLVLVDDIDWSNGFFSFVVENNLYPLLLTDNGKDNLRVRSGLISNFNKFNKTSSITLA